MTTQEQKAIDISLPLLPDSANEGDVSKQRVDFIDEESMYVFFLAFKFMEREWRLLDIYQE